MKRWVSRFVFGIATLAVFAGATGCAKAAKPDVVARSSAETPKPTAPSLAEGQQRVDLNGLLVTLTMPDVPTSAEGKAKLAAGRGSFVIKVRAENSTDQTITVPISRNTPVLLNPDGSMAVAGVGGTGGSGWVNRPASSHPVAATAPSPGPEGLAPHGYFDAFVVTTYSTDGRDMSIRWALGESGTATFKLR